MSADAFDALLRQGRPIIIGEVGQAHDGSLGTAHQFIDAVADSGAHAVKFQTHIAAAESTRREPWRVAFSRQDVTRFEYWKRMEFTAEQWAGLRDHAVERGLFFLSTPFSLEACDLLEDLGIAAWKVSSGEIANDELLSRMAATGWPVLLSTGMSPWSEIDAAVEVVRASGSPLAVLQCTTAYPTAPDQVGLNVLAEMRERYRCPVGLSDHSATVYAGLAAVSLGAAIVEVHVTLSRRMFGPDVVASLTVEELTDLVAGCAWIHRSLAHPIDKDREAEQRTDLRTLFTKSLVARTALPAGHVLAAADLMAKKPGEGIPPERIDEVIGRTLAAALEPDDPVPASLIEAGS